MREPLRWHWKGGRLGRLTRQGAGWEEAKAVEDEPPHRWTEPSHRAFGEHAHIVRQSFYHTLQIVRQIVRRIVRRIVRQIVRQTVRQMLVNASFGKIFGAH